MGASEFEGPEGISCTPTLTKAPSQPRPTAFTSRDTPFAREVSAPRSDLSATATLEAPAILHASSSYRTPCGTGSPHGGQSESRDTSAHRPGPSRKGPSPHRRASHLLLSPCTSLPRPHRAPGELFWRTGPTLIGLAAPQPRRSLAGTVTRPARVFGTASPGATYITSQGLHSKQAAGRVLTPFHLRSGRGKQMDLQRCSLKCITQLRLKRRLLLGEFQKGAGGDGRPQLVSRRRNKAVSVCWE